MKIIQITPETKQQAIQETIQELNKGQLVIYPTETCYGIAADATNENAIQTLLQYKRKRTDKPISIAVANQNMAEQYVHINPTAQNIIKNFLPGPITVVCKGKHKVAPHVESPIGTLGIRIPAYPLILELIETYNKPITATSANASYKKTPYFIQDILDNTTKKQQQYISLILDAGTLPKQKTSTVMDTTLEGIHILRQGDIQGTTFHSHNEQETKQLAKKILETIEPYLGNQLIIIQLQGDLGAGKTYFTKYFCEHLQVPQHVNSPTFTICNEYQGTYKTKTIPIYHIDAYRLYDPNELHALGGSTLFQSPNIVLIEWAGKIAEQIQPYIKTSYLLQIYIQHYKPTERIFTYLCNSNP